MAKNTGSEKTIEDRLKEGVESECAGMCIKLYSVFFTGLPDRMLLFPGARIVFVELKSTGKKQSGRQQYVSKQLRALGFTVLVIDTLTDTEMLIDKYRPC